MFEATTGLLFFDEFRVPHRLLPDGGTGRLERASWVGEDGERRSLYWPNGDVADGQDLAFDEYTLGATPVFARVADDRAFREQINGVAPAWTPHRPLRDPEGREVGAVWVSTNGDVAVPFDLNQAILSYWSETYRSAGGPGLDRVIRPARAAYYRLRPLMPRSLQIRIRQRLIPIQSRARFPKWPIETALHDLYDQLFELLGMVAREPVPFLSPWPRGRTWALVLTHDVETEQGCELIPVLRDLESELDLRSSWNFVPERYPLDVSIVTDLQARGFEVGVHGARHDGRDLASARQLASRLPAMKAAAARWNAVGFRSPATQRDWDLMPLLPFEYDSSYPDTDPYEPQAGGCCSWLPFFNRDLVELPLTLPQDHTLFVLLQHTDESLWLEKTEFLRDHGGMALLNTHPDYVNEVVKGAYANYLRSVIPDSSVWAALPSEVASWWRRRGATTIDRSRGEWEAQGPAAAECEIRLAKPV